MFVETFGHPARAMMRWIVALPPGFAAAAWIAALLRLNAA